MRFEEAIAQARLCLLQILGGISLSITTELRLIVDPFLRMGPAPVTVPTVASNMYV